MNVLLINPPSDHLIRESLPPVVEDNTGVYPPLGLLYIAAYAQAVPGCSVKLLDCQAEMVGSDQIVDLLSSFRPKVVGIQAMTFTLIDCLEVARVIKKAAPEAMIVFGGPHPTIFPLETIRLLEVDVVVVGEGEYPFERILQSVIAGDPIHSIPGVITKETVASNQGSQNIEYIKNLDLLKMPARNLLNLELYSSPFSAHQKVTTMMSSRGCPGRCIFCDRPQMGKIFRKRSSLNVVKEMTYCARELDIREIIFYDDTFTIDADRVNHICEQIIESGLKILWDIRARIDTVNATMLRNLRQAGCIRIHYGVETGTPRLQKLIRKNLNLDKVKEVFAQTRKEGIETLGYFMIGLPTETKEEIQKTVDFALSLEMDYAHFSIFTPYPGTEVYREALDRGVYISDHWREFAQHPLPDFIPKYWNEHVSDQELIEYIKRAYSRFYYRPKYLFYRILKVKSPRDLIVKAKLAVKLFKEIYS